MFNGRALRLNEAKSKYMFLGSKPDIKKLNMSQTNELVINGSVVLSQCNYCDTQCFLRKQNSKYMCVKFTMLTLELHIILFILI